MNTERECPGCDWGSCDQRATESYVTMIEVRPFCEKHGAWNRNLLTTGNLLTAAQAR